MSAFFITAISFDTAVASTDCQIKKYDQTVSVARVSDGDTVLLTDKRKVRLIGINTPELAHYPKKAEAFSLQAKRYLQNLLRPTNKLYLKYGAQQKDRYGRVLAHLFLRDGRNVNALLVESGLASAVAVPPNLTLANCYFRAEKKAQKYKRNIWAHPYSQYIDAGRIIKTGYAFVTGKVMRVGRSRDSVWWQLAKKFTIRIKRRDFKYFPNLDINNLTTERLKNKKIYIRGWVYKWKKEFYLQARHTYMMQLK